MKDTFITLHRKLLTWRWFKKPEMLSVFIYLLLRANFEKGCFFDHDIQRGEVATSIDTISKDTGLSFQKVRTCLKRLQKTQEINIKSTNKFTIVTLVNYELYQDANKKPTSKRKSNNKQLTTSNNNKQYIIDFYNSEIENNSEKLYIDNYKDLIEILKGENPKYDRFDVLLSLQIQLTYKAFERNRIKTKEFNQKNDKNIKIIDVINEMEANGLKNKSDFGRVLDTFVNNAIKWSK